MIELIIKLQEWIIKLIKDRDSYSKEVFDQFYRPIYDELMSVHNDYLYNISKIRSKISEEPSKIELMEFVKEAKSKYASVRQNIIGTAGVLEKYGSPKKWKQQEKDFIHSILVYLKSYFDGRTTFTGVLSLIEEMYDVIAMNDSEKINYSAYKRRYQIRTFKDHMLDELNRAEKYLEHEFSEISLIYNRIRLTVYDQRLNAD